MSKTLEGLAKAYWTAAGMKEGSQPDEFCINADDIDRMKAALLWLAENVSDEMVDAADAVHVSYDSAITKEVIAAALRKAVAGVEQMTVTFR